MFAIYNNGGMWEDVFDSIEKAKEFAGMYCEDWEQSDFKDFRIVEIVPRLKVYVPPQKIVWENAD